MIFPPSRVQLMSIWVTASGKRARDVPPSAATIWIAQGFPGSTFTYATCFLSGDHRGRAALEPEKVSCRRSDPSTLQRQSVPSGTDTKATHSPSAEKSRSVAEIPARYGKYLPLEGS